MPPVSDKTITGRLASGLGEGASFTGLQWAREQFVAKLGIDPFPGTLNVALRDPAERARWARLRGGPGTVILAPDAKWCNARCYRVRIGGWITGAIVVPEVPGYPDDKIEMIASVGVRAALGLMEGDVVVLEIEEP